MSRNTMDNNKVDYSPVTDYVNALKGDDFQEMNKFKVWNIIRNIVSEIFGTAMFVGIGCGSAVVFPGSSQVHFNEILGFGFAVTLAITAFGHISGALINPSLTFTGVFIGKISLPMFIIYTVSQCIGATFGLAVVKSISPADCIGESFCLTLPDPMINVYKALLAESFMTFCLAMVFCSCSDDKNKDKNDSTALKFGFSVIALAIPGAKYTGCSMNPARSFGPALLSGNWTLHWVYWVGPLTGAACAGLIYQIIFSENIPEHQKKRINNEHETLQLA